MSIRLELLSPNKLVRTFHEPRAYRGTCGLFARLGFQGADAEIDGAYEVVLYRRTL